MIKISESNLLMPHTLISVKHSLKIRHICHYRRQCIIFASGVNFSIKQHILWHNKKQLKLTLPSPISTSTSWVLVLYSGKYSVKNKAAQQEAEIK